MKLRLPIIQPKRSVLQQKALVNAIMNSAHPHDVNIYCPYCGAELVPSRMAKFETIDEHVSCCEPSNKQGYTCTCELGKYHDWIRDGGQYSSDLLKDLYNTNRDEFNKVWNSFNDYNFTAALNTFNADAEVSIYKNGLKDKIYLWPWLTLNKVQLYIEHHYEANNFGQVTKHWVTIGFLKKDDGRFCIVGSWALGTWKYQWWKFKNAKLELNKIEKKFSIDFETEDGPTTNEQLKTFNAKRYNCLETMFKPALNESWPWTTFNWFVRNMFRKRYKQYLEMKKEEDIYKQHTRIMKNSIFGN